MSAEDPTLTQRVQDALQVHLEDQGGGFPTEFLLISNYIDSDGEPAYFMTVAHDQRLSTTLGLSQWGALALEADARRHFAEDDE